MTFVLNWRPDALKGLRENKPVGLMSGDAAPKDIARRITAETEEEHFSQIRDVWGNNSPDGARVFETYLKLWEDARQDAHRRENVPKYEAQLKMIEHLESTLIVN